MSIVNISTTAPPDGEESTAAVISDFKRALKASQTPASPIPSEEEYLKRNPFSTPVHWLKRALKDFQATGLSEKAVQAVYPEFDQHLNLASLCTYVSSISSLSDMEDCDLYLLENRQLLVEFLEGRIGTQRMHAESANILERFPHDRMQFNWIYAPHKRFPESYFPMELYKSYNVTTRKQRDLKDISLCKERVCPEFLCPTVEKFDAFFSIVIYSLILISRDTVALSKIDKWLIRDVEMLIRRYGKTCIDASYMNCQEGETLSQWELFERVDRGMARTTQVELMKLAFDFAMKNIKEALFLVRDELQNNAQEASLEDLGEAEEAKLLIGEEAIRYYNWRTGSPTGSWRRYQLDVTLTKMFRTDRHTTSERFPLLFFLAGLRSESIESRIWKYVHEE